MFMCKNVIVKKGRCAKVSLCNNDAVKNCHREKISPCKSVSLCKNDSACKSDPPCKSIAVQQCCRKKVSL